MFWKIATGVVGVTAIGLLLFAWFCGIGNDWQTAKPFGYGGMICLLAAILLHPMTVREDGGTYWSRLRKYFF